MPEPYYKHDAEQDRLYSEFMSYVACMEGSTSYIKTFDEWLNS
jgi:hypothetical protein